LAGVGIYILFDNGAEVDLLYELKIPHYPHEAQEQLGIYKTGEFTIQVKVRLCLFFMSKCPWHGIMIRAMTLHACCHEICRSCNARENTDMSIHTVCNVHPCKQPLTQFHLCAAELIQAALARPGPGEGGGLSLRAAEGIR
jgi:hypothetical protein